MMSNVDAVRSPPWFSAVYTSKQQDLHRHKSYYVRSDTLANGQDPRLSNVGAFILSCQSVQSAFTAGELYVEYEVVFSTPTLNLEVNSAGIFSAGEPLNDWPMGSNPIINGPMELALTQTAYTIGVIIPSTGYFYFTLLYSFSNAITSIVGALTLSGSTMAEYVVDLQPEVVYNSYSYWSGYLFICI